MWDLRQATGARARRHVQAGAQDDQAIRTELMTDGRRAADRGRRNRRDRLGRTTAQSLTAYRPPSPSAPTGAKKAPPTPRPRRPSSEWSSAVGASASGLSPHDTARRLVEPSWRTWTRRRSSSPTIGRPTSHSPGSSSTTGSSTTQRASTSVETPTRTPSRARSAISRPGCVASTSTMSPALPAVLP